MKKYEMIKELVKQWVRTTADKELREERYIHHDRVESYLNSRWTKEGIEMFYNKVFNNNEDINRVIGKATDYKFIF